MADIDMAAELREPKSIFKPYFGPGIGIFFLTSDEFRIGTGIGIAKRSFYVEDYAPKYTYPYYTINHYGENTPLPLLKEDLTLLNVPLYFSFLTIDQKKMSGGFTFGYISYIDIRTYYTWGNLNENLDMTYYKNGINKKSDPHSLPVSAGYGYGSIYMLGYFMDFNINDKTYFSINPNLQFGLITGGEGKCTNLSFGIQGRIGIHLHKMYVPENNGAKTNVIKIKLGK